MTVAPLADEWSANSRIRGAANNQPPMKQGEGNAAAVKLLQTALVDSGFSIPAVQNGSGPTGFYGGETRAAVLQMQENTQFQKDGVAGREVIGGLDLRLRGWRPNANDTSWGDVLALFSATRAREKVEKALAAVRAAKIALVDPVTIEALATHFKLLPPGSPLATFQAQITNERLDFIIGRYKGIKTTLENQKMFVSTIPENGIDTVAEAPFGGPVRYGPYFCDGDIVLTSGSNIQKIGPESRAAVIIHEATHVVDFNSGLPQIHISEFDTRYATQLAVNARENPSAYATFAHHIATGSDDPTKRPGLGPAIGT